VDAPQTVFNQVKEIREIWIETWWSMSGGEKAEYDRIKATNVLEFWKLYDLWKARNEAERDALEQQKKLRHGRH
jgi:hypothetical protein